MLAQEGLPRLVALFDALAPAPSHNEAEALLEVLFALATYDAPALVPRLVAAARRPLAPEAFRWFPLLEAVGTGHPDRDEVFAALSDPLPDDRIALALLDAANHAALTGAPVEHPFDSAAGAERLRGWLSDPDPDREGHAHSAAVAVLFLSHPSRGELLGLAFEHGAPDVRLEAAWASAKLGSEAGVSVLARACLEPSSARRARGYLREVGRADAIPEAALEPRFVALADFAEWLAHPCELGLLARIWHGRGRVEPAAQLLLQSLERTAVQAADERPSERGAVEADYQALRSALVELFADADARLARRRLPRSLLA